MEEFLNNLGEFFKNAGWKAVYLLLALSAGIIVIKFVSSLVKRSLQKSPLDNSAISFIVSVTRFGLYLALAFIIVEMLDISMSSFVAILGAAGLAIGLALQGSLANLASGIVIIFTKPFREGDFVEIGSVTGKVKAIRIFTTELVTSDNKKVAIPNNTVATSVVTNYNGRPTRRIEIPLSASYRCDIGNLKSVVLQTVQAHPAVLSDPAPTVVVTAFGETALKVSARCYTLTVDYWDTLYALNEQIFAALKDNGIEIPIVKYDVNIVGK